MNVDDRPYSAPAVESIDLGTDTLVYDGDILHLLNGSAAGIWRRADGQHSVAQIAAVSAESVSGQAEDVHSDVMDFLDRLIEQGLLVTSDLGAPAGLRPAPYVGYVLDGSHVLLVDLRSGTRQALSPTGSIVWRMVCQHGDPATVLRLVRTEFPAAPASLETDVTGLLEQLRDAGLLVPIGNERSPGR